MAGLVLAEWFGNVDFQEIPTDFDFIVLRVAVRECTSGDEDIYVRTWRTARVSGPTRCPCTKASYNLVEQFKYVCGFLG